MYDVAKVLSISLAAKNTSVALSQLGLAITTFSTVDVLQTSSGGSTAMLSVVVRTKYGGSIRVSEAQFQLSDMASIDASVSPKQGEQSAYASLVIANEEANKVRNAISVRLGNIALDVDNININMDHNATWAITCKSAVPSSSTSSLGSSLMAVAAVVYSATTLANGTWLAPQVAHVFKIASISFQQAGESMLRPENVFQGEGAMSQFAFCVGLFPSRRFSLQAWLQNVTLESNQNSTLSIAPSATATAVSAATRRRGVRRLRRGGGSQCRWGAGAVVGRASRTILFSRQGANRDFGCDFVVDGFGDAASLTRCAT